jgi:glycosyltransferase involved in cell wall biosynthesis
MLIELYGGSNMRKKVLIIAGYYIPGVKAGGPIQSIKNLVDNLSDKIEFYIVAADRDLGDDHPFSKITTDKWIQNGNAKVIYTDPSSLTIGKFANIINSIDYDVMYLNSFFSFRFSILPIYLIKIKKIKHKPIVLAPRGQFSPGALKFKNIKKRLFIKIVKVFGLYRNITWHATANSEKKYIEEIFGFKRTIRIANNLTADYRDLEYNKSIEKRKGELKIVFISRIHPKKNLKKAIELLKNLEGKIEFNIYGPIEDEMYWNECEEAMEDLPKTVRVVYNGILEHDRILDAFKNNHVFLFPTLGENFGHVISEALIGGCPVIISDQTPWRNLKKQSAGWDISLSNLYEFEKAIQYCVDLDQAMYNLLSKSAFEYGISMSNNEIDIQRSYNLFI